MISIEKPNEDTSARIHQLRSIAAAYKAVALAEPLLPSSDSPLPALLALRSALRLIDETKSSIREYKQQISGAQSQLKREISDLDDTRRMTNALTHRLEKLHREKAEMAQKGIEGTVETILQTRQQEQMRYEQELKILVGAFNTFVNDHLATMIAAEQLGGPVVGDNTSIDEKMLRSGFNKLGKVKKTKTAKRNANGEELSANEVDHSEAIVPTERRAAGAEFRKLTEELLNALADEENPNSYITIGKESAAVRFLIRAKVAQFDPEDARKLRLMQFGAKLEDVT